MSVLLNDLVHFLHAKPEEVEYLLSLTAEELSVDPLYRELVHTLDRDMLAVTQQAVNAVYEEYMRQGQYAVAGAQLGGSSLVDWVQDVLGTPERAREMVNGHGFATPLIGTAALLNLADQLDQMDAGREQWQRALAVSCLPLIAQG